MLISTLLCTLQLFFTLPIIIVADGSDEDYYKLLGIEKTADLRAIRKAFKSLAVQKHPDKNQDDPKAHEHFVKLAEAYEVLKDPTKRNHYDLYGKQSSESSTKYHSYTYYRDQFGIYDDDPLIETLSKEDMQSSIGDNIWFINFYSPWCSHCHHLAPEWRKLSKLLEGVVKIGAVNCEDEKSLCWDIQIRQYPTLMFFKEKASIYDGEEYHGRKTSEIMETYVMDYLEDVVDVRNVGSMSELGMSPWVLFLCGDGKCHDQDSRYNRIKLAAVLKSLVSVGVIEKQDIIEVLSRGQEQPLNMLFWQTSDSHSVFQPLYGDDHSELATDILHLLPEANQMNTEDFQHARNQLRSGSTIPWLMCFTLSIDTQRVLLLKKLAGKLDDFKIGEINCGRNGGLCGALHIVKYPTWAILKPGGGFEIHTGPPTLNAIERFALETREATNIQALSPQDLQRIMSEGSPWLIGWLLTGCPPCKRMLPALRKASNHFSPDIIQFGTVDCAVHTHICNRYNVRSFPTTSLYNASTITTYQGDSSEQSIVDFVQTMKSNYVVNLDAENFHSEISPNSGNLDAFVIEFYAPWCAPCQRLQPEWLKLAHKLSYFKKIKVGAVNCEIHSYLCQEEGIRTYPTIRLYPVGLKSLKSMTTYGSTVRDYASIRKWVLSFLPSPITILKRDNFRNSLLSKKEDRTWVVMFFAPWCGYCHQFEPEFFTAVQRLENIVVAGKIDCQKEGALCQSEGVRSYPTVKLYQRVDGVTKMTNGIEIEAHTQESLYAELKTYAANAYITLVDHDEL